MGGAPNLDGGVKDGESSLKDVGALEVGLLKELLQGNPDRVDILALGGNGALLEVKKQSIHVPLRVILQELAVHRKGGEELRAGGEGEDHGVLVVLEKEIGNRGRPRLGGDSLSGEHAREELGGSLSSRLRRHLKGGEAAKLSSSSGGGALDNHEEVGLGLAEETPSGEGDLGQLVGADESKSIAQDTGHLLGLNGGPWLLKFEVWRRVEDQQLSN